LHAVGPDDPALSFELANTFGDAEGHGEQNDTDGDNDHGDEGQEEADAEFMKHAYSAENL
jgi:hypothetical protein